MTTLLIVEYMKHPTAMDIAAMQRRINAVRDSPYTLYWDHTPSGYYVDFPTEEEAVLFKLNHW